MTRVAEDPGVMTATGLQGLLDGVKREHPFIIKSSASVCLDLSGACPLCLNQSVASG